MRKVNGIITFAFRLLRCYLFVVAVGSIDNTSADIPTVKSVTPPVRCGDSPVWISDSKSVYFIDPSQKTMYKYRPEGKGEFVSTKLAMVFGSPQFLVPISADNTMLFGAGLPTRVSVFPWDGKNTNDTYEAYNWAIGVESAESMSCGRVDSSGRLWVATSYGNTTTAEGDVIRRGRMFVFGADGTATKKIEDIGVPTGIAWNPTDDRIYFVDNYKSQIVANTFKSDPGEIVNDGKVIFDFVAKNVECGPNDLTVDTDGNLWIACLDSSYILKIDIKTSAIATLVDIPEATSISSLVFGGPTLEDLYVTSCSNSAMFLVTNTGSKGVDAKAVKAGPSPPQQPPDGS